MNISRIYDFTNRINNNVLSAITYKIMKLIVNVVYRYFIRPVYGVNENSNIIVSLTSFPDRINMVWITILSLLHQTVKPKQIILWLAEDQFLNKDDDLPKNLLKLKKYGLNIRYCDNLFPHKKYYYAMLENPDATIITVDDDVIYPEYLIEKLKETSKKYPKTVCCTWAHRITTKNGSIASYNNWEHGIGVCDQPEMRIMPVGIGGVLYPPHCLDEEVFNKDSIKNICLKTDDLWLKSMAVLNGTKAIRIEKVYKKTFFTLITTQKSGLYKVNVGTNKNDDCMKEIIFHYPKVLRIIINSEK